MKYSRQEYEEAVRNNFSFNAAYRHMSGSNSGSGATFFKNKVQEMGIDTSHFDTAKARQASLSSPSSLGYQSVLTLDRRSGRREDSHRLRNSMIKYGFAYMCVICSNDGFWISKSIRLEIDHINGNNVDNRPENLQFLCPNCHSQKSNRSNWRSDWAEPFTSKYRKDNNCIDCGYQILMKSIRCKRCSGALGASGLPRLLGPSLPDTCSGCGATVSGKLRKCRGCADRPDKILWPDDERLASLVFERPLIALSEMLGVSDRAIKKRCEARGVQLPPLGYWIRKENLQNTTKES